MPVRTAEAVWTGDLSGGEGRLRTGSGALEGAYSFASRFEEGTGTNPEELLGAAQAGCFSMALANGLAQAGYEPRRIRTGARVSLEPTGEGFAVSRIHLQCEADVPDCDPEAFQDQVNTAKENCPVSRALSAVPLEVDARLAG